MKKKIGNIKKCKFCGRDFIGTTNQKYCTRRCATMWIKTYGAYYIPKGTTAPASLCWNCGKATGGSDCPWANRFEPVEGWTATPTIIKADRNASFMVHQCPLYKEG